MSLNKSRFIIGILLLFACRTPYFIRPVIADKNLNRAVFLVRMNDIIAEDGVVEKLGNVFHEGGFTPVIPFFTNAFLTSEKVETIFKADSVAIRQLKIPISVSWLVLAHFKHYAIENTSANNGLYEMSCMVEIKLISVQSGQIIRTWKFSESGIHSEFDLATQLSLSNLWTHLQKNLIYELKSLLP
ncbi:MAG: hypothetical protein N2167_00525 [Flavobacteriales bacterium]|nr:hypothetical protein [Flavobacteriales bacterium]